MTKRNLTIVLAMVLIMGLLLPTACSKEESLGEEEKTNELVLAIGSEPDEGFDPVNGWGRYGNPLFQSTLVDTDVNMEIVMDLAKDYKVSQDGFTWTFEIREDVIFTDEEELTSDDIVFTFESAKGSGSIVDLTNMKGIKRIDDYKVEFTLNKPDSSFIYTIAATGIVPKHAYDANYGENPVGSGPFKLIQWDKGQQVIMAANEDYYGKLPAIKKVTILFLEEDATLAAAKAGQLDVGAVSSSLAGEDIGGMRLEVLKSIDNRGITLPYIKDEGKENEKGYKLGNNVTSDIAIRRALSYGIDRESLVRDVLNDYGRPAYSEADGMPWSNSQAFVKHDLERAKEILSQGGWDTTRDDDIREKNGQKAEFDLLYSAGDSTRQALANGVALQAKELGIKINIQGTSWDEIDKKMYSQAILMGWGAQSPIETYLLYHSDNAGKDYYNPEFFSSEVVDYHIDNAMSSLDHETAMDHWKKVQWDGETGVASQGESPWVWLVNLDHLYYIKEGLDIGQQKIHPHGHAWPLLSNLKDWEWK